MRLQLIQKALIGLSCSVERALERSGVFPMTFSKVVRNSAMLPLVALCALSFQPAQAGQTGLSSASYWDHIVGGAGASAATWYVPPSQMTAYFVSRDSSINARVRFGNYYQFTCTDGFFHGPTTMLVQKLTPGGWVPLPTPVGSMMEGTISAPPEGAIDMKITTPAQNGNPEDVSYAKGHMIFVAGEWRMTMQTTLPGTPDYSPKPPYVLQWANMTKLAPGQQIPSLDQARDSASLRSDQYSWLQDTEWSVQDTALWGGAAGSFRIDTYVAGYFFGSSTGANPFWVSGSVAPDGSLYIVLTSTAAGLSGGIYLPQIGSITQSNGKKGRKAAMNFASYPHGFGGAEYSGAATLIDSHLDPAISYDEILRDNESVTGVRGFDPSQVILTGSYLGGGRVKGMWWRGSLDTGRGTYYKVAPAIPGRTVTSSLFYGPDTALFNPSLGAGNVRIVGSYQYSGSPPGTMNYGVMFTGALDGRTGAWTPISVPVPDASVIVANTIPHSTMGDLVVGNYDLATNAAPPQPIVGSGNAFVYRITSNNWTILGPSTAGTATGGTTLYGVWQNGSGSTSYTLAGGAKDGDTNTAFLVDYDSGSGQFSNLTYFADSGAPGFTHFEGITGRVDGYNLIATTTLGPAFVSVDRTPAGFGPAKWTPLNYPASTLSTGNTVYEDYALGLFFGLGGLSLANSYVAHLAP